MHFQFMLVSALSPRQVSDATFGAISAKKTPKEIVDMVAWAGYAVMERFAELIHQLR